MNPAWFVLGGSGRTPGGSAKHTREQQASPQRVGKVRSGWRAHRMQIEAATLRNRNFTLFSHAARIG